MKNAIFLPLTALLIAQSLSSCWKSSAPDRSHVGGRILEYGTDTPIEGAKVHLSGWSGSIGGGGSGGGHTAGSTTYSDRDGYYSFDDLNDSGVQLVNATKEGYFTDLDTEEIVLDDGNYDDVDVRIKPYAWLKVTIRNESGAYGFFPPQDGSGGPPVQLVAGSDTTFALDLRKGNDMTKYIFSIRTEENGPFPDSVYWQGVKAFANGFPIDLKIGTGAFLDFYLAGHDTTNLVIKY